jgi:hypothetical protein
MVWKPTGSSEVLFMIINKKVIEADIQKLEYIMRREILKWKKGLWQPNDKWYIFLNKWNEHKENLWYQNYGSKYVNKN